MPWRSTNLAPTASATFGNAPRPSGSAFAGKPHHRAAVTDLERDRGRLELRARSLRGRPACLRRRSTTGGVQHETPDGGQRREHQARTDPVLGDLRIPAGSDHAVAVVRLGPDRVGDLRQRAQAVRQRVRWKTSSPGCRSRPGAGPRSPGTPRQEPARTTCSSPETPASSVRDGRHPAQASPALAIGVSAVPEIAALVAVYPNPKMPTTDIEGRSFGAQPAAGAYAVLNP